MNENNWRAFRIVAILSGLTLPVAVVEAEWLAVAVLAVACAVFLALAEVPTARRAPDRGGQDRTRLLAERSLCHGSS